MDWTRAVAAWSPDELSGITTAVSTNLEVALEMAKGWLLPTTRTGRAIPDEAGIVTGLPWHLEARCGVDGAQHRVSPVCPHLGGIMNWNDIDNPGSARCTDRDSLPTAHCWKDRPPGV